MKDDDKIDAAPSPEAAKLAKQALDSAGKMLPGCCNCHFARMAGAMLECRLRAPSTICVPIPQGKGMGWQTFSWFPIIRPEQWCGEYRKSEAAGADAVPEAAPKAGP